MTFEEFSREHFEGDEQKAMAHLVHESYYNDFPITGSKEALQAILNTFDEKRTKEFWKEMKIAVKKDNKPLMKDMEPYLAPIKMNMKPKWVEDEEFIRKGNPFGRKLLIFGPLFLVSLAVLIVLLRMANANAWSGVASTIVRCLGSVIVLYMLMHTIELIRDFFYFRSAEKKLKSQEKADE